MGKPPVLLPLDLDEVPEESICTCYRLILEISKMQ